MKRAVLMLLIAGSLAAQSIELNTGKFWRLTWRIRELERQIKDQGPDASWSGMLASLNAEFQAEQKRLTDQCGPTNYLGYLTDTAGNAWELACLPKASPADRKLNLESKTPSYMLPQKDGEKVWISPDTWERKVIRNGKEITERGKTFPPVLMKK